MKSLFLDGVRVLVIGFGDTSPFPFYFEQKQEVGKVNMTTPPFFKHSHHNNYLLYCKNADSRFETINCTYAVNIAVELVD